MDISKYRLIFMGTPSISARLLESLILEGYNFVAVVTKLDAPIGRKQVLTPPEVKVVAQKYNIPVYQFQKIKHEYEVLLGLKADAIICLAYGQIIPMGLIEKMPLGCLNFHGSLLPKYRGAAPLQRAIINGEKISGCTAMEMVKEMDAGVMYQKIEVPISDEDNYTTYREKFINAVIPFSIEVLPKYLSKTLPGQPQDESQVTFANMINKEEQHLDLELAKTDFVNLVRGLSLEPGGYLLNENEERFKILGAKVVSNSIKNEIGVITKADRDGLFLQLKDGEVALLVVQTPGKRAMSYQDIVNGNKSLLNTRLH